MVAKELKYRIAEQLKKIKGGNPEVELIAPCKRNEGIVACSENEKTAFIHKWNTTDLNSTFFIPASGSGSRMFQFLYDFLSEPTESNRGETERFLNHITDFAFYEKLPLKYREELETYNIDLDEFVSFLLNSDGMNLGNYPKGLIPFHRSGPFILNAFQDQVLQGLRVKEKNTSFHFTINPLFEKQITNCIENIEGVTGQDYQVSFSYQDKNSDAIPLTEDDKPIVLDDNEVLQRPAGHGALLPNLNAIDSDVIFLKNIDNIQQIDKSDGSIESLKFIGGILISFKEERNELLDNPNSEGFKILNKKYQFLTEDESLKDFSNEEIIEILNRPIRVCGMVRNEGQPGGGPFWVKNNGVVSKQIVEKAQITMKGEQYRLMVQSSYFNPVLIAAHAKDKDGNNFDLSEYRDDSKYFVVKKNYKGQPIKFCEEPGLWNGSMSDWISVFVEVPSNAFSPVKTVLDLLQDSHRDE